MGAVATSSAPPERLAAAGRVIQGKDGWLFLKRDTALAAGEHLFNPNQLRQWRYMLETRHAWLQKRGVHYFMLMPPTPPSVYPEHLPGELEPAGRRTVHQVLDLLAEHEVAIPHLYPLDEMIALKGREPQWAPFPRNESHWSDAAGYRSYELVLDRLPPEIPGRRLAETDLEVEARPVLGDLGRLVDPPFTDTHYLLSPRAPRARLVRDNRVYDTGRMLEYECGNGKGSCVMIGDSFGYWIAPFMAETFRRFVLVHRFTMDFELMERERPDVVVSIHTERLMVRVPQDQPYQTTQAIVRRKRAEGSVLADREPALRPDTWPPLNLSE
jgi:alginate O-acetyltransferase complex protein AlgJ